jgi:acetolactate synthase-1/2/3 large subunit
MECLRLSKPGHFLAPVDFSCMGYALPAAIGAQLANPEKPVVTFMGDGAFLMTGMELMTATQLQVPIVIFILRDRKLGLIAQFQEAAFGHRSASDLPDFQLDDLCKGLGAQHCQIAGDSELADRIAKVQSAVRKGPVVVEVLLAEGYETFFAKGVVRTNLGRLSWSERTRFVGRAIARRLFSR